MTVEPLMGLLWAYLLSDVIPEQQRWPEYARLHLLICDILCSQFHPNKAGHTLLSQQALGHHRAKALPQPLKNAFIQGEKKDPGRWRGSWNTRQNNKLEERFTTELSQNQQYNAMNVFLSSQSSLAWALLIALVRKRWIWQEFGLPARECEWLWLISSTFFLAPPIRKVEQDLTFQNITCIIHHLSSILWHHVKHE